MINTTIFNGCDEVFCYNLDLVSMLIGFGLGAICFIVSFKIASKVREKRGENEKTKS